MLILQESQGHKYLYYAFAQFSVNAITLRFILVINESSIYIQLIIFSCRCCLVFTDDGYDCSFFSVEALKKDL